MAVNKVVYGNTTVIDITDTTATAAGVDTGTYFYTNAGVKTQGTLANGDNGSYGDGNPSGIVPVIPHGTVTITQNGTGIDIAQYAYANITVPSGVNNQNKTVTPSLVQQTVQADQGYTGLGTVTVNAMPEGSATQPSTTLRPTIGIEVSNTGLITASVDTDYTMTPTVIAGYVLSGTSGTVGVESSATQQLSTMAGQTVTPSTSQQTLNTSGKYMTGNVTVNAIPSQYKDVSGVTATASDVVSGKSIVNSTGTVNGSLVIQHYYTGSSAPSSSLGVNGDIYLRS